MRHLPDLFATIGLLAAGILLLALGLHQVRARRLSLRWPSYRGSGDVLLGTGISAGAAYHLNFLISE